MSQRSAFTTDLVHPEAIKPPKSFCAHGTIDDANLNSKSVNAISRITYKAALKGFPIQETINKRKTLYMLELTLQKMLRDSIVNLFKSNSRRREGRL